MSNILMEKDLALSDIIKTACVELNLKSEDKDNLIAELVEVASKSGKLKNKKAILAALLEREKLGSTAIGNGVAIPHTKIDHVEEPILAFGRSCEGVDFNSLDGGKTHIFFILISPKEEIGAHLKILAKISHIIKDKFTVGLIKKAKDKKDALQLLLEAEKHLEAKKR